MDWGVPFVWLLLIYIIPLVIAPESGVLGPLLRFGKIGHSVTSSKASPSLHVALTPILLAMASMTTDALLFCFFAGLPLAIPMAEHGNSLMCSRERK